MTSSTAQLRQLFEKQVSEVVAGTVEIVSIVRESGRLMAAVRSHDSSVHPVACVGTQRTLTSISRELGDEKVAIVLWSESLENFILNALTPFGTGRVKTPRVTLDAAMHQARVEVSAETLAYFSGEHALRVRLASKLVGWDIRLVASQRQ
jgi:transcription termination/antitermination protein NusA